MTLLHEPVDLGSGARLPGGILSHALPLPDNWENGVGFLSTSCTEPQINLPCAVTDSTEVRPGDPSYFEPIFIQQSAACSTLSQIGTVNIASNRLEATTEWALGRLLATGLTTDNPALADAELVHAATGSTSADILAAVSCLEQAVADVGFGGWAVLHAPLRAAAYLSAVNALLDGFRSPAGLPWIISSGYPVTQGETNDIITLWATSPVFASVTDAYTLTDGQTSQPAPAWRQNLDAAYRQRLGLVAFDPCLNVSVTFTVPACIGGS